MCSSDLRPIRVGDQVTVGDLTGKVARIRIRATTLANPDHKEVIIPNKEFITGNVVNWTLSDRMLRLTTRVGVAYGSNPAEVQRLLLEAARSHPNIAREPAPQASLEEFGDSSLNFVLFSHVVDMDLQWAVRHELNTAIDKKLREHGIEIPFPQQDVNLHTQEPETAPQEAASANGGQGFR